MQAKKNIMRRLLKLKDDKQNFSILLYALSPLIKSEFGDLYVYKYLNLPNQARFQIVFQVPIVNCHMSSVMLSRVNKTHSYMIRSCTLKPRANYVPVAVIFRSQCRNEFILFLS